MATMQDLEPATRSELVAVAGQLSHLESPELQRLLPAFAKEARTTASHWDFEAPARVFDRLFSDPRAFPDGTTANGKDRLRRALVARLALDHFRVDDRLPRSIVKLYPDFFRRLSKFLFEKACYFYPQDYYVKDIRYALGLTVPCGAHQLDLKGRVGPKLIFRDVISARSPHSALAYAACRGWGPWYSNHLDLRAMKEFSPKGWTSSFIRIAEMLKLNPHVRGVAGVSWFHDPCVGAISPHLGYIQTPTHHGAFLAHLGSGSRHVDNATVRSFVRTKLFEEGKYLPTCYLLAWPRKSLISWAERVKKNPSIGFHNSPPDAPPCTDSNPVFSLAGNRRTTMQRSYRLAMSS
jgi:hypothetical protein